MSIRAVIVFFYAIILYRLIPRKAFGNSAVVDIVVTVIAGSSLSRALTGNAELLATLAATAALLLLHVLLSVLTRRSEFVSKLVKGRPVRLVQDGKVDWKMMRRAQLGERDLGENLRLNGVAGPGDVAEAYLERNGSVSVIRAKG
jgi:uncharacterized membrane protein YcaP (DUF421 family)